MSFNSSELQSLADEALKLGKDCNEGANADYIPFLASVPSDLCAISIACCDGTMIHAGDHDYGFALESISKVCSMSLAMQQKGAEQVREKIGAEPTGLAQSPPGFLLTL